MSTMESTSNKSRRRSILKQPNTGSDDPPSTTTALQPPSDPTSENITLTQTNLKRRVSFHSQAHIREFPREPKNKQNEDNGSEENEPNLDPLPHSTENTQIGGVDMDITFIQQSSDSVEPGRELYPAPPWNSTLMGRTDMEMDISASVIPSDFEESQQTVLHRTVSVVVDMDLDITNAAMHPHQTAVQISADVESATQKAQHQIIFKPSNFLEGLSEIPSREPKNKSESSKLEGSQQTALHRTVIEGVDMDLDITNAVMQPHQTAVQIPVDVESATRKAQHQIISKPSNFLEGHSEIPSREPKNKPESSKLEGLQQTVLHRTVIERVDMDLDITNAVIQPHQTAVQIPADFENATRKAQHQIIFEPSNFLEGHSEIPSREPKSKNKPEPSKLEGSQQTVLHRTVIEGVDMDLDITNAVIQPHQTAVQIPADVKNATQKAQHQIIFKPSNFLEGLSENLLAVATAPVGKLKRDKPPQNPAGIFSSINTPASKKLRGRGLKKIVPATSSGHEKGNCIYEPSQTLPKPREEFPSVRSCSTQQTQQRENQEGLCPEILPDASFQSRMDRSENTGGVELQHHQAKNSSLRNELAERTASQPPQENFSFFTSSSTQKSQQHENQEDLTREILRNVPCTQDIGLIGAIGGLELHHQPTKNPAEIFNSTNNPASKKIRGLKAPSSELKKDECISQPYQNLPKPQAEFKNVTSSSTQPSQQHENQEDLSREILPDASFLPRMDLSENRGGLELQHRQAKNSSLRNELGERTTYFLKNGSKVRHDVETYIKLLADVKAELICLPLEKLDAFLSKYEHLFPSAFINQIRRCHLIFQVDQMKVDDVLNENNPVVKRIFESNL